MSRLLSILVVLVLLLVVSPGYAQQEQPLVVFILDDQFETAQVGDAGPTGVSRLATIFNSLGAEVETLSLAQPLPETARVVVIVRPLQGIPTEYLARLWHHLEQGNHLLLALDPNDYAGIRNERSNSGFAILLNGDYGINIQDTFLSEFWFNVDALVDPGASLMFAYPDLLPNPVTEPLTTYDLNVKVWGARTLRVEPIGINSRARPLLRTNTAFGETSNRIFAGDTRDPLELNIGVDLLGKLNLAALGENTASKSRIVVLADSEMLLNEYGLAQLENRLIPRYPGNRIFVERLVAWLLDIPLDQWPPLPTEFSWIALDGQPDDWAATVTSASDSEGDSPAVDIQRARAFYNDSYLYLLVETAAPPDREILLNLNITDVRRSSFTLSLDQDQVFLLNADGTKVPIFDAEMVIGDAIEVRLPLRVAGVEGISIQELCVSESGSDSPQDCLDEPLGVGSVNLRDPVGLRLPQGPTVTITPSVGTSANLRSGPGTIFPTVATVNLGTILAAIGRNETGDWILVENATSSGWLLAALGITNTAILSLPVVETPAASP